MAIFPLLPALGWISSTILGPVYVLYYGNDCAPLESHIRHRKTVLYLCFPFSSQFSCHHSPPFSFEQIATFKASLLHFHFVLLAIPPFSPGKPKIKSKSLLRAHSDTKASLIGTFMALSPHFFVFVHTCMRFSSADNVWFTHREKPFSRFHIFWTMCRFCRSFGIFRSEYLHRTILTPANLDGFQWNLRSPRRVTLPKYNFFW